MRSIIVVVLVIGLAAGGTIYYAKNFGGDSAPKFKTTNVKRGDLMSTITATGTLEPEEVVDVGAQVQGRVLDFASDPRAETDPKYKGRGVYWNTPVEQGTVLAHIDDSIYRAARDQAKASYDRALADVGELVAKRNQAEAEWNRAQKLHDIKIPSLSGGSGIGQIAGQTGSIKGISDSDFDLARANFQVAKANADVGDSAVAQAKAALDQAETNLSYTVIVSPVKGQILDRRVSIGQTVVASLNTPSLFLIAKDLRRMDVWASVNEADIGKIKVDMTVHFTVDAYPEDVFHGKVKEIRLNAQQNQNVVLYTVEISADNSDLKLYPYLTADVKFELDDRKDVWLVSNAALNWQPKPTQLAPSVREAKAANEPGSTSEEMAAASAESSDATAANDENSQAKAKGADDKAVAGDNNDNQAKRSATTAGDSGHKRGGDKGGDGSDEAKAAKREHHRAVRGTLWVKDGDFVRPVGVTVGLSDGIQSEISGADLTDNMEVVFGEIREDRFTDAKNPFAPQWGGKGGGGKGMGGGGGGRGGKGG